MMLAESFSVAWCAQAVCRALPYRFATRRVRSQRSQASSGHPANIAEVHHQRAFTNLPVQSRRLLLC